MLFAATISAILQVVVVGGIPFVIYWMYHRVRHKRSFADVARKAGLQLGNPQYLLYAVAFAGAAVLMLTLPRWHIEPLTRPGSAQYQFVGLGLTGTALVLAFLNGVVQTSFAEELLFRGLIAGSLSRRLPIIWANILQALIFLLPHLPILRVAPEVWPVLPIVFASALVFGWLRIKSGSILGSWIIHATGNVTMALLIAARTA